MRDASARRCVRVRGTATLTCCGAAGSVRGVAVHVWVLRQACALVGAAEGACQTLAGGAPVLQAQSRSGPDKAGIVHGRHRWQAALAERANNSSDAQTAEQLLWQRPPAPPSAERPSTAVQQ